MSDDGSFSLYKSPDESVPVTAGSLNHYRKIQQIPVSQKEESENYCCVDRVSLVVGVGRLVVRPSSPLEIIVCCLYK